MKSFSFYSLILAFFILLVLPGKGRAQDFVYTPKNPAFGGSYLNYSWMLSSAKAQNKFQGNRDFGFDRNPLDSFKESLQRRVLSEITQNVVRERFGEVDLSKKNNFEFGEFSIDIVPGGQGININITDNSTGDQTTVTVPNI